MDNIKGYRLIKSEYIKEVSGEAYLYEHINSGARLIGLKNNDKNKVFCITLLTSPEDDCGTAHIIEHSVLCGSDKYPLKEPFVQLLKTSLNTFLNAMTYPDKTMYPVASMNDKDFENLVDVYCDAVFNPLIKTDDFAFLQEGHHYEYDSSEDKLTINGVVYNEMKGATSSPEDMLFEAVEAGLFPGTIYSFNSGGDPKSIPELTYEKYLNFYNKHYHPSNSYIFIYGDTDIKKHMETLDEKYLSAYGRIAPVQADFAPKQFSGPTEVTLDYAADDEQCSDKYWFACNYAMAKAGDTKQILALNVLSKILFDTDSSVLKKALTDAKIGEEVYCSYTTEEFTTFMSIYVKNAPGENLVLLEDTIKETLEKLCKEGIDDEVILSCVNNTEFFLREADAGSAPKGLIHAIRVMENWLYGYDPFEQLKYEGALEYLRKNMGSDFYVGLIRKYFLENKHTGTVTLKPVYALGEQKEAELSQKLEEYKNSLSKSRLVQITENALKLRERQNTPDSPEDTAKIPVLEVDEIARECEKLSLDLTENGESRIFTYTGECSDIVYVDFNFDAADLSAEQAAPMELLRSILGVYATDKYSEYDLGNTQGIYLGDSGSAISIQQNYNDINAYERRFTYMSKALFSNADKLFSLSEECLLATRIDDTERLKVTIREEISKFENSLVNEAETHALLRMDAACSHKGAFRNNARGENYYRYLLKTNARLNAGDNGVLSELKSLAAKIVTRSRLDILITCDKAHEKAMISKAAAFAQRLPERTRGENTFIALSPAVNEGIIIPSAVCYTAQGINLKNAGGYMPESFGVCRKYLYTDYLWNNIRVKGGAYGAMIRADRGGDLMLVSYRDPNVKNTYRVYEGIPEELMSLKLSKRQTDNFIIGTISDMDSPKPVYAKGRNALGYIYADYSHEQRQALREAVLSTTVKDLNDAAIQFELLLEKGIKVALAPANKLNEYEGFDSIRTINRNNADENR
ncbi:MAG: hypothetical protein GX061_06665 [Eubacteriaceae bacterium]|nr:hypothetical protein [Eubacteriaceae bacterium]